MSDDTRPLILVADDEDGIRRLAAAVLAQHGYAVLPAADGDAAVRAYAARPGPVAAALLDVSMPGGGGPAALAALHRLDPALPCVLMSGDPGFLAADIPAGARAVLPKPFALDALVAVVRAVTAD
jgi:DNA-binding NtrC family response regulator